MTSILQAPVLVLLVLPTSDLPLEVFLKSRTVRPAWHSLLEDVTFPWNRSVVLLYAIEMWLATAAYAACVPTSATRATATKMRSRLRIDLPPSSTNRTT